MVMMLGFFVDVHLKRPGSQKLANPYASPETSYKPVMQASRQALPRTLRASSVRLPASAVKAFSTSSSCCADPSSSGSNQKSSQTHFGFQSVPESIKESLVGKVFSSVASSYDVMNDAMSLGVHRLWKDHYVKKLDPRGGLQCLDVAGGTGDIALRILNHAKDKHFDRKTHVQMLDINPQMLEEGKKRFATTMYHDGPQISFMLGNAEELKGIEDNSKDLYTIAFGIRNCTHIDRVLKEAYRVLKPGGVFSCLEFGKVNNPLLAKAYETYSFQVIPNLGHIIASDRDSYQYLVESIERFPQQADFAQMIRDAGFTVPKGKAAYEDLTFGVAAIHTAVKL